MNIFTYTHRGAAKAVAAVMMMTLFMSAFPAAFFVAFAATPEDLYVNAGPFDVVPGLGFVSDEIDATTFENLKLQFAYNAETLDGGGPTTKDIFEYGVQVGATQTKLGEVEGNNENASPGALTDETGTVDISIPALGQVSNLEIYMKLTGGSDGDEVVVTNLKVVGEKKGEVLGEDTSIMPASPYDSVLGNQDKVDICHSGNGKNYVSNSPNVSAFINLYLDEIDKNGHHNHDDDIIPPFDFNTTAGEGTYPGKNWNVETAALWENGCKDPDADYATVTLVKEVTNEVDADLSLFALLLEGDVYEHGDEVLVEVDGVTSVEITEDEVDGYELKNISCVPTDALEARIVQLGDPVTVYELDLEADDAYTCTIVNEKVETGTPIEVCKYEVVEGEEEPVPYAGWEMTLTNDKQGDDEVTTLLTTLGDGCVTAYVDVDNGPWIVSEEISDNWEQVSAVATNGEEIPMGDDYACQFFSTNTVTEDLVFRCDFVNQEQVLQCVDELDGSWVDGIASFTPGKTKDNAVITDPNRIDPDVVVGASDWVPNTNDSTGFVSLGYGGSIVVSFDSFVPNVPGADLTVYEATNGNGYPAETALVEVSQDGVNFLSAGVADNATVPSRTTTIDFDATGYEWIKYVRVTDTTNPALHNNASDGFDLDAIKATQQICKLPEEPVVCSVTVVSDATNTVVEKAGALAKLVTWFHNDWDAIVAAPAAWIWGDDPVTDPVSDTTQTFLKKFGWNGPVTNATLTIAADNSYEVTVNDTYFGGDAAENNFSAADVHDLTTFIAQGNNELEIAVKNFAQTNGTVFTNPAGLKYELVIKGSDEGCDVPYKEPEPEPEPLVCDPKVNLLVNPSFEAPVVADAAGWDIFDLATYPALGWAVEFVSAFAGAPDVASLELQTNVNGWTASDGAQYAELDSDWQGPSGTSGEATSVMINQVIPTIPGAEYTLSWDFSPRPGTTQTENDLEILINDAVVKSNSAAGGAAVSWTGDSYTFTASGNTTKIAFADDGTPNSVGTFLDNTSLVCGQPAPQCSLEILSSTQTIVVDSNDFAVETYDGNDRWTASIPGAEWIWDTDKVIDPTVDTIRTFEETFTVNGPMNAALDIAADNSYRVFINGNLFLDRSTYSNNYQTHTTKENLDITSFLISGENTVRFEVTNHGVSGSNHLNNPAGVLFKIALEGTDNCAVTTDKEPETYTIDGYKWNDLDGDGIWDKPEEPGLPDWTIYAYNLDTDDQVETTTDANGYYAFTLPAGEWEISEGDQANWYQTAPVLDVCVIAVGAFSFASAVVVDGDCNFGNQFRDGDGGDDNPEITVRGSSGGSSSPRCEIDFTREGNDIALDWSSSRANEMVLTANGEEIFSSDDEDEVDNGEFTTSITEDTGFEMTVSRGSRERTCSVDVDVITPDTQVAGEQVSVIPLGAADAGAGGAVPFQHIPAIAACMAVAIASRKQHG